MESFRYGDHCFDRDWMAAGPRIDDEAKRRGILSRISVEEFLYGPVECMEAQPEEDHMVHAVDTATLDPDWAQAR